MQVSPFVSPAQVMMQPTFAARGKSPDEQINQARQNVMEARQLLKQLQDADNPLQNGKKTFLGAKKGATWGLAAGLAAVLVPGGIAAGVLSLLLSGGAGAAGGGVLGGKLSSRNRQKAMEAAKKLVEKTEADLQKLQEQQNPPQPKK